jgi:hypothetical protein
LLSLFSIEAISLQAIGQTKTDGLIHVQDLEIISNRPEEDNRRGQTGLEITRSNSIQRTSSVNLCESSSSSMTILVSVMVRPSFVETIRNSR